jgi:hypothetical protein
VWVITSFIVGARLAGTRLSRLSDDVATLRLPSSGRNLVTGSSGFHCALFPELHHGDPGDGLGHGADAEDRVFRHRRAATRLVAEDVEGDDLAILDERVFEAGDFILVDGLLHAGVEGGEAFGGEGGLAGSTTLAGRPCSGCAGFGGRCHGGAGGEHVARPAASQIFPVVADLSRCGLAHRR